MTDWETDLEMKKLRDEFIASLASRHTQVVSILKWLSGSKGQSVEPVVAPLTEFCHKLAGVAESYDFATLSRISGAIEDWLTTDKAPGAVPLSRFLQLLDEALVSAQVERVNPDRFDTDERMSELTSVAGSSRAGSTPGSS